MQFVVNYNIGYNQPLTPKHNVASHLNVLLTVFILFNFLKTQFTHHFMTEVIWVFKGIKKGSFKKYL